MDNARVSVGRFRAGVAASSAAVGAFLLLRLTAWPPHEDETLALFVGRGSLSSLADTVLGERGGAPLHFLAAWAVAHAGGGLTALRLLSAVFAVASIPVLALVVARLVDRTTALLATVLVSASWMLLFHGVYGRMYSLFLFTSALSYLALLVALERGGARRWALWAAAVLLCVATHPYGALVLGSQAIFVLIVRERLREATGAFAAVAVLGIPFWLTDLVLAGRFDVGVGGRGEKLGGPWPVLQYLGRVAEDFTAGAWALPAVLGLAALGAWHLWREHRRAAWLVASVFATPTLAFLVARLGSPASPETRHLIFALPFFAAIVARGLVELARRPPAFARRAAVALGVVLVAGQVAWAWQKTPLLFEGDPRERTAGRAAAAAWLAETGRPDDVLLGYEPVYLDAWRRSRDFSRLVLPRADARLAASELQEARRPLGRGVWVFDGYDTNNMIRRLEIPFRRPMPQPDAFEARVFGPYLVVRTREPTGTPLDYLRHAAAATLMGRTLSIGDSDINFQTVSRAAQLLGYEASDGASRSMSSR
jgi:Dolichyl-phosphate-mannose-protein mannosyltransferase